MARSKIDYGIYIGIDYAAICRIEEGVPVIQKTDTLKDFLPIAISFLKNGHIRVGDAAVNDSRQEKCRNLKSWIPQSSNVFREFTQTLGTDKIYHSTNRAALGLKADYSSIELVAEVFNVLKSFVKDEEFCSAVISVPATFTEIQKNAILEAAKLAGLVQCEILTDTNAVSIVFGTFFKQFNGYFLTFDFEKSSFSASLHKVKDRIIQIIDTGYNKYLGGTNIDYAIVDGIIIPYLRKEYYIEGIMSSQEKKVILRDALKSYAKEVRQNTSNSDTIDILSNLGDLGEDENGDELELDLSVSQSQLESVLCPLLQDAIGICKSILRRNNLTGKDVGKIMLVGMSCNFPIICKMLTEQISSKIDTSIEPTTAIVKGAAILASVIDVECVIDINVSIIDGDSKYTKLACALLPNDSDFDIINLSFSKYNPHWESKKEIVTKMGSVIELQLSEGENIFSLDATDADGKKINLKQNIIKIKL